MRGKEKGRERKQVNSSREVVFKAKRAEDYESVKWFKMAANVWVRAREESQLSGKMADFDCPFEREQNGVSGRVAKLKTNATQVDGQKGNIWMVRLFWITSHWQLRAVWPSLTRLVKHHNDFFDGTLMVRVRSN
jgi:hypothetical protein